MSILIIGCAICFTCNKASDHSLGYRFLIPTLLSDARGGKADNAQLQIQTNNRLWNVLKIFAESNREGVISDVSAQFVVERLNARLQAQSVVA